MKIISCGNCGIMLDTDRIPKPDIYHETDCSVDITKAIWDGDDYVPIINCPLCTMAILYSTGDKP